MKNLQDKIMCFSVVALLFVFALGADAQKGEIGLRYMPTFSAFEMKNSAGNTVSGEVTPGYGFAAFGGFSFTDHLGVQGEIQYSTISQKYIEVDVEREVNLRYFNIPFLLSLNTGKHNPVNLNIVVGPQLGISAGSDVHVSGGGEGSELTHATLSVKTTDVGFAYGLGFDYGLDPSQNFRIGLGFRGVYGLFDISDNSKTLADDSFYVLDRSHVKTYAGYIGFSLLF
jgi:hypothetical protein